MSEQLEGILANGEIKELHQILAKPHVKVSFHTSNVQQNYKHMSSLWGDCGITHENIWQFWLEQIDSNTNFGLYSY